MEGEQVQWINVQLGNKLVLIFSFGFIGLVSNLVLVIQDFDFIGVGFGLGFVFNLVWVIQDKGGISVCINSSESSVCLVAIFMEAIMW